jgi:hypothetical protein
MNRRQFLQAAGMGAFAVRVRAQTPAQPKLKIDAYSRHLQWLRSADEVADAARNWVTTAST